MAQHWSIADVWNLAFQEPDKPLIPRDYLYASELGKPFVDVFLKMKATPITNPITPTAKRKMEAGKLMESIVLFVLKRAGVLRRYQKPVKFQPKGCLLVSGKLDYLAGGNIDAGQSDKFVSLAIEFLEELGISNDYIKVSDVVREYIKKLAADDPILCEYIYDAKSVSDFVFRLIEASNKPRLEHRLQVTHYCLGDNKEIGKLAYISREDLRLNEVMVYNNSENYEDYVRYVSQMTGYFNEGTRPPLEPLIVYEQESLAFNKNTTGVEWSSYLTLLYGFTSSYQYRNIYKPLVTDMNYVFKRCYTGENITKSNLEKIAGFKKHFPNWDDIVDKAKFQYAKMQNQKEDNASATVV